MYNLIKLNLLQANLMKKVIHYLIVMIHRRQVKLTIIN